MSIELTPERQQTSTVWRNIISSYIGRTTIHEFVGTYENDDDPPEAKT